MVRWTMQLSQYNFGIEFVKGNENSFADMLSREILSEHSMMSLRCNYIRLHEGTVEIETSTRWVSYNLEVPLLTHDEAWYPIKEVRYREDISYLWTETMQDDMNEESIEALDYLEHIGSIICTLERDDEDDDRMTSFHIIIRIFDNHLDRNNYDLDRQKEAFFIAMNLQNCSANLFYSVQF